MEGMKSFTLAEYSEALRKCGPKGREYLLQRAIEDRALHFPDLVKLEDLAECMLMAERASRGGVGHEN